MKLTDQKKGTLLAFTAIMFITPDSLLIRLSNIESWNLIFYRGLIPFVVVFIGLLIIYKTIGCSCFMCSNTTYGR